ncbi:protein kinase domain-containing protein [Yoonia sp.]|uniref:protein kinase domain-containing protein n=1 Tax=Yoonia sp. TaxID=2212373 RepID=UPI0028A0836D|nr:hypothetical protein [Yoonia sp.]
MKAEFDMCNDNAAEIGTDDGFVDRLKPDTILMHGQYTIVEGRDMLDTTNDPKASMTPTQIKPMLIDVLGAVGFIHDQDILHSEILPDNILIDPNGCPVLINFGAAREEATKQSLVLPALSVVKDGYSPQELSKKTAPTAVDKAERATAPAKECKSKVGMLLASAAVIAAIGIGAAFSAGVFDGKDVEMATAPTKTEPEAPTVIVEDTLVAGAAHFAEETRVAQARAAVIEEETRLAALEKAAEDDRIAKAAFIPSNEIIVVQPEETFVLSAWSVELPFSGSPTSSRVIGRSIANIEGVSSILRDSLNLTNKQQLSASFGIMDGVTGDLVEKSWLLPIVQQTALLNGVNFETSLVDNEWATTVTQTPDTMTGDLRVADKIVAYMRTSERMIERMSLKTGMDREVGDGQSSFNFAVSRDREMWVASLDHADSSP